MKTTLSKWGNSLAVRIPKPIADDLNINPGTEVHIELKEKVITIQSVQPEYKLEEMLKKINKTNIHSEVDTGTPIGKEIW